MKKTFGIEGLDCAHCAAKIENNIKKIEGVNYASLNFIGQKLILDVDDDIFDSVLKQVNKAIKKVERGCELT